MAVMQFVVVIFAAITCMDAANLPSYIKPCSISDPNLNKCAKENGQAAIPSLVKGDRDYKIPNMTPLVIPEINFSSGNLNMKLNNAKISGFENARIKDMKVDLKKKHVDITVGIEWANLLSHYALDGSILVLPIKGEGNANLTHVGGLYHYVFDYDFKQVKGETHIGITRSNLDYTTKKAYFYFDNLFNGDQALGDQTNNFLNENYQEVERDIGPALSQTISNIITAVVTGVFDAVPYNKLFTP